MPHVQQINNLESKVRHGGHDITDKFENIYKLEQHIEDHGQAIAHHIRWAGEDFYKSVVQGLAGKVEDMEGGEVKQSHFKKKISDHKEALEDLFIDQALTYMDKLGLDTASLKAIKDKGRKLNQVGQDLDLLFGGETFRQLTQIIRNPQGLKLEAFYQALRGQVTGDEAVSNYTSAAVDRAITDATSMYRTHAEKTSARNKVLEANQFKGAINEDLWHTLELPETYRVFSATKQDKFNKDEFRRRRIDEDLVNWEKIYTNTGVHEEAA